MSVDLPVDYFLDVAVVNGREQLLHVHYSVLLAEHRLLDYFLK